MPQELIDLRQITHYDKIVSAKEGADRHFEIITRTAWYTDECPVVGKDQQPPMGRIIEVLEKVKDDEIDLEGRTHYKPIIYLEVNKQAKEADPPQVFYVPIVKGIINTHLVDNLKHFTQALKEFIAFRGYINDDGVKGNRESKYLKEIGVKKDEINNKAKSK